jgi:hypothetical protein
MRDDGWKLELYRGHDSFSTQAVRVQLKTQDAISTVGGHVGDLLCGCIAILLMNELRMSGCIGEIYTP